MRVRAWQVAAATVAVAILWVLAQNQAAALRSGRPLLREFMAFYTVGYVLNRSPEILYNPDSFDRTYHALFPAVPADVKQLYGHAPFEAVVFRPFALLPFERALVAWQLFSLVLFGAGFTLVWRSSESLPWRQLPLALLLVLSFQPVAVASIARGQVSALTFFWIALAIWCQRRGQEYWSGAALAMCLSKPNLLVLLLPMLVVGWRLRTLIGFIGGAGTLGTVSLAVVGWRGCADYVAMILRFAGRATAAEASFVLSEYVDLNSFLRMMSGGRGHLAIGILALVTAGLVPCLAKVWQSMRRGGEEWSLVWASTLTWTTILNLYVAVYDTPIILLGILLMTGALNRAIRGSMPWALKILFVLLYVVPWIPPVPVGSKILQLYTVVLIALGVYQVWLVMRRAGGTDVGPGRAGSRRAQEALATPRAIGGAQGIGMPQGFGHGDHQGARNCPSRPR